MSILKGKERTYEFSLEGYTQCKADGNKKLFEEYDTIKFMLEMGIFITGAIILCNPMADMIVAYKTETELLSQVAYKVIEGVL